MRAMTFPAWVRALDRAGLRDLYLDSRCVVSLALDDGRWHAPWSRCARQAQRRAVPMATLVSGEGVPLCGACGPAVPRAQRGRTFTGEVDRLREVYELAGQALRFANRADSGRGRSVELGRKLARELDWLEDVARRQPDLAAAAARMADRVREAQTALTDMASSEQVREQVLTKVREVLVPARFEPVTVEEEMVLVGLWQHHGTSKDVQEVIDAFRVPVTGGPPAKVLLRCPRFVVDYLNRAYSPGLAGYPLVLTVPAAGVAESVVEVAAALWAPGTRTPMADLATALAAAANSLATAG